MPPRRPSAPTSCSSSSPTSSRPCTRSSAWTSQTKTQTEAGTCHARVAPVEALELIANDDPPLFDDAFDAAVQTALDHLNKPFRTVVDLVDIRGLSYAEAAAELGIPIGTIMSRLHRARRRMRDQLEGAGVTRRSEL